ncbi:hypothetical protein, partial [Bifidobacterium adolescentis]|uniref:hypothetical protein n=1 Tax=Bifidobacterium adolescentis TaxID=1680 RepID=UPI00210A0A42
LANVGAKTLRLPKFAGRDLTVYNVGRDEGRVYMTDSYSLVADDDADDSAAAPPAAASAPSPAAPAPAA